MLATGNGTSGHAGPFAPFLKQPVRFDILSRRVPPLDARGTATEREAIEEIVRLLGDLNAYVGDFRAGLKLLDHAEANETFAASWGPIACRDASVSLTSFREALKRMVEALRRCPSLKRAAQAIRPVEKRFVTAFPAARARNGRGVGSSARNAPPQHRNGMCDATIRAAISREGRRVLHATKGREMRFELSEQSLWRLVAFRNEVFGAFEEVPD